VDDNLLANGACSQSQISSSFRIPTSEARNRPISYHPPKPSRNGSFRTADYSESGERDEGTTSGGTPSTVSGASLRADSANLLLTNLSPRSTAVIAGSNSISTSAFTGIRMPSVESCLQHFGR
jgi:hypothetical protein